MGEAHLRLTEYLRDFKQEVFLEHEREIARRVYPSVPAVYGDHDGHGGKAPTDSLTVYLAWDNVAAGTPLFKRFSLAKILHDDIQECAKDGSYLEGLERIREGLLRLSGQIERATKKAKARQGEAL